MITFNEGGILIFQKEDKTIEFEIEGDAIVVSISDSDKTTVGIYYYENLFVFDTMLKGDYSLNVISIASSEETCRKNTSKIVTTIIQPVLEKGHLREMIVVFSSVSIEKKEFAIPITFSQEEWVEVCNLVKYFLSQKR